MSRWVKGWWCALGLMAAACGSGTEPQQAEPRESPPSAVEGKMVYRWNAEPPGEQCEQGGTAVQSGVDANANGLLDDAEVSQTTYTCHGSIRTEAIPGTQVLLNLAPEAAGANCYFGGTAVSTGIDSNGNGVLEPGEITQTQYVCSIAPPYQTGWAASSLDSIYTGLVPVGFWTPSGRKVTIFKASNTSRLKVTVTDNFLTGYNVNAGYGYYEVRMNGGAMSPRCYQGEYSGNAQGWGNVYAFPFSTVCLTDVLPAGLYEFETWVYANVGQAFVGDGAGHAQVVVDEIPSTASYGFSSDGGVASFTATTFQRAPGRTVSYTKQSQGTLLKITLADTLRVGAAINGGYGTLMVRVDNADTSCSTGQYDAQGTGGDFHDPLVMTCILSNVAPGAHTVSVWVRADVGAAYIGWERSSPLLLVEEVVNQGMSYNNAIGPSGELGGDWSGVAGRWLSYTVNAPGKTLRLTYSDTFRSAAGCNGYWGFYQLYVDSQPTGCSNGQYASNGGAGQDHHHPINQVCLIKNLAPGPHVFTISSTTRQSPGGDTCGTNYFGWGRGQPLLMLEELK